MLKIYWLRSYSSKSLQAKKSYSKRKFLHSLLGITFISYTSIVFSQKEREVVAMQSHQPEYQPEALNLLKKDSNAIVLDTPPLADTGNSIPFSIKLIAPKDQLIRSFEIIAPENPFPMVLRVRLPQAISTFQLSTRIRLALSQDVWVIALLENGQKIANSIPSVVTLNACFDAT